MGVMVLFLFFYENQLRKGKIMENYLLISDAAKEVKVESHVLRYWEEELHLPIKRNELGHRYYTKEDVERFRQIKNMKEKGLQLKAIKMILKDGKLNMISEEVSVQEEKLSQGKQLPMRDSIRPEEQELQERREAGIIMPINIVDSHELRERRKGEVDNEGNGQVQENDRDEKARRVQWLLRQLIRETLLENNQELCKEIKESVVKELDYQFRTQEEREEERERQRDKRNEEYYQRMDDLLRKKSKGHSGGAAKEEKKKEEGKKKRHFIF